MVIVIVVYGVGLMCMALRIIVEETLSPLNQHMNDAYDGAEEL